jgi:hypothetical protein
VGKTSYTVSCASGFRDAVEGLARRRGVNVADIARSVLLMVPPEPLATIADPGEPAADDRESVLVKSGAARGRPWRRKPRLQLRLPPGNDAPTIRRALALALALDSGQVVLRLEDGIGIGCKTTAETGSCETPEQTPPAGEQQEELERLRTLVSVLSFEPLKDGVRSRADALHVLGFPPAAAPDAAAVRARFRMLATIHHPDSGYGDHRRMSQLNAAMDMLRGRGR